MSDNQVTSRNDFVSVTELTNDEVAGEQVERLAHRYLWAGEYCRNKDVLEVACGAGQGLGYLSKLSKTFRAGDISNVLVEQALSHYGQRIDLKVMDAMALPFKGRSLDVVVLFEAIYYLPSAGEFAEECRRVLRPGGRVLIATANKDLYDFNPSPFSQSYYGVAELGDLFRERGFTCEFFGYMPVDAVSWRQRLLRPVKAMVVKLNLLPKTMAGKKMIKRLVFGRLVPMPAEIDENTVFYAPPIPLTPARPDHRFKVIYLAASFTE